MSPMETRLAQALQQAARSVRAELEHLIDSIGYDAAIADPDDDRIVKQYEDEILGYQALLAECGVTIDGAAVDPCLPPDYWRGNT